MKRPSLNDAKALARKLDADGVIVLSFEGEGGCVGGASYGKNKRRCAVYGRLLDELCAGGRIVAEDLEEAPANETP